ncbi:MAG: hypothetical protein ACRBDL_00205 [Alphaproteobacteria bacterium]
MQHENIQKEKNKILFLYFIFSLSISTVFIPNLALSVFAQLIPNILGTTIFAVMVTICILAGLYSVRSNAEEDSLLENHTTYIIRIFWRTNLFLFYFSNISIIYIILMVDYSPLKPCIGYIEDHIISMILDGKLEELKQILSFCEKPFLEKNQFHLYITAFIAFGPAFLYYALRSLRGSLLTIAEKIVIPYAKIKR